MIPVRLDDMRSRLCEAYATARRPRWRPGGCSCYRRDIRPLLPPPAADPVVDLGRGRGEIVRLLQADGFDAQDIET